MIDFINTKSWQAKEIAKKLETNSLVETCRNILGFNITKHLWKN